MTRNAVSAVWPIDVAFVAAIEAEVARDGSVLGPLMDDPAVWSGMVPEGIVLTSARIVMGASAQFDAPGSFSRIGADNTATFDIWTADTSKRTALVVFGEVYRLIHRQPLALTGYGEVRGSVEMILSMLDPSRQQYHASCRYKVYSLNPAA